MTPTASPRGGVIALLLASLSIFLSAAGSARAVVTLVWGNEMGSTNVTSSGSTALDSSFSAALGTFAPGFTPSAENTAAWEANWSALATVPFAAQDSYFNGQTQVADNAGSPAGAPLYIWVRNSAPLNAGGEWFLATDDTSDGNPADNWTMPSVADADQTTPPLILEITCAATDPLHVIFGGLGSSSPGLSIQAGGLYTDPAAPGWCLQTHTLTAVPEPSAVLLVLAASSAGVFRRRRKS